MGQSAAQPSESKPAPTNVRYAVVATLCLAAAIAYVPRLSIGVAEKLIQEDLALQDLTLSLPLAGLDLSFTLTPIKQMGWVMGAFFLSYAIFQLPTGWLAHWWGARRSLPLFALLWSAATGCLASAGGFPALLLAWLGAGAAQAGIFPCSTSSVAKWFPVRRQALANGLIGGFMSIGGAIGIAQTGYLLGLFGAASWRWIFLAYSLPGIAWAVFFYLWFRDRPEEHKAVNDAELGVIRESRVPAADPCAEAKREPTPWIAIFTSYPMWCICGQAFFRAAGYMFFGSWFARYLRETREVSTMASGIQTSMPVLATVLGSVVGGLISDWVLTRTGSRRLARQGVAVVSLLTCVILILAAYGIANAWLAVLVISAGSFCAALAGPCSYTITIDMGGHHVPTVFGTMNMAGNLGAFLFPIVVPEFVSWTGNWDLVLFLFAGIYLAGAICWLPFNPNGTIFERPGTKGTESAA